MHLVFALVASVVMWIISWVHFHSLRGSRRLGATYRIPLELLGVAFVGHLGGFVSGVNSPV
jgi:hypothetical protein